MQKLFIYFGNCGNDLTLYLLLLWLFEMIWKKNVESNMFLIVLVICLFKQYCKASVFRLSIHL